MQLSSPQYWAFSWTFFAIPVEHQWVLALLLPLTRELGNLALTRICTRIAAEEDFSVELVATNLAIRDTLKYHKTNKKCYETF